MVLLASLVGCSSGEDGSQKDSESSRNGSLLSRDQAEQILNELPEVIAWAKSVKSKSHGRVVPVCDAERTPSDFKADGKKPAWQFKLEMAYPDRAVLWQRFQVDAKSGDVSIWDPFKGYIPIDDWRGRFRP